MKFKKTVSLVLATLIMASALTACGGNSTSSGTSGNTSVAKSENVIKLTYWAQADRQKAFEPITKAFNESQKDINVTVSYYDTDGIKNSCKVAAASNTLPDMWFNWGGKLAQYYVDNGCTYDLTAFANKNGWADKFKPAALSLCKLGGKLSGYPTNISALGMFYKKSTFQKYSIQVPTTLEQLETACATLKKNGVTPFSTTALKGWDVMRIVEQLVEYYAGADTHDKLQTMSTSWDSDAVVSALTKYQEWGKLGYYPKGFLTNDPNDTLLALATGKCAMDLQGQWYDGTIASQKQKVDDMAGSHSPTKLAEYRLSQR
jgi:raffinose/stachyose/melibiose transport system substrate-binding protein